MGACASANVEHPGAEATAQGRESKAAHQVAEREMKETKKQLTNASKILLLGSGDSGKSTVLKQMRIINSVPWTAQELETYRLQIYQNLVQGMRLLLDCLKDMSENPPPSLSLSTTLPPSSPYMASPRSIPSPYASPHPISSPNPTEERQRSGSISSNATLITTNTGTTLGPYGSPSSSSSKGQQRFPLTQRKLTYTARHAELRALLDDLPDLREGDPFPLNVGDILVELWGLDSGAEWAGTKKSTTAESEEAERVLEIDSKETGVGQNDVRECVERAKVGGSLPDNLEYFFSQLPRLFGPDYTPNEQDIVRCRIRTIGITETVFTLKKQSKSIIELNSSSPSNGNRAGMRSPTPPGARKKSSSTKPSVDGVSGRPSGLGRAISPGFTESEGHGSERPTEGEKKQSKSLLGGGAPILHVIDVGGQKSERRKWIHCFEDVTAILFLVSLSGYCQSLVEDVNANQMQDAMTIWDGICSSQWFRHTPIILFLNKEDLFRARVPIAPIKSTFPDYDGPLADVEAGKEYFLKRFLRLAIKGARARPTTAQANAGPKGKTGFIGALHGDRGVQPAGSGERFTTEGRVIRDIAAPVGRNVYHHFTNATDTTMLRVVMSAVTDIILRDNFARAHMI